MSRKTSMPVLWGALGCAAALALFAGDGLTQQMEAVNYSGTPAPNHCICGVSGPSSLV
jgi:hypothetical protein